MRKVEGGGGGGGGSDGGGGGGGIDNERRGQLPIHYCNEIFVFVAVS
jgi:hypothetical protein